MRASLIRRAQQASEKFLTANNPTGLAGLLTHPYPRPALIGCYRQTLEALSTFPKDSAYRTSVEAITNHRLSIVESVKPEGFEAWATKLAEKQKLSRENWNVGLIPQKEPQSWDDRDVEWDGTGSITGAEKAVDVRQPIFLGRTDEKAKQVAEARDKFEQEVQAHNQELAKLKEQGTPHEELENKNEAWLQKKKLEYSEHGLFDGPKTQLLETEHEPPLTAQQISDLEQQIGAGLIEEVIVVAENELKLVEVMRKNAVWEELVEKVPEGQWGYFERTRHVKGTQAPPSK